MPMTSKTPAIQVVEAKFPDDLKLVTSLFTAYAASLPVDLSFQFFTDELTSLPGKFSPAQNGTLLLARTLNHETVGCVALRALPLPSHPDACELKRLFVVDSARGLGAGKALMEEALKRASELGFKEVLLDTLGTMVEALRLYEKWGFIACEKYYNNPLEGVVFMKKVLG